MRSFTIQQYNILKQGTVPVLRLKNCKIQIGLTKSVNLDVYKYKYFGNTKGLTLLPEAHVSSSNAMSLAHDTTVMTLFNVLM